MKEQTEFNKVDALLIYQLGLSFIKILKKKVKNISNLIILIPFNE